MEKFDIHFSLCGVYDFEGKDAADAESMVKDILQRQLKEIEAKLGVSLVVETETPWYFGTLSTKIK